MTDTLSPAHIDQLIAALRQHPPVPWESVLWDVDDIAEYLKVSRRTVAESYAIQPNFPVALRPGGGYPRYLASEIVEWAEACRPRKNNRSKS